MKNFFREESSRKKHLEGTLCFKSQPKLDLPAHVDRLLDLPWTPDANRLVDLRLWYSELEFEGVL